MYTEFYKLNEKPFQISSDPRFIWLGEKHKEALATLKYGVIDNKGLMLLTGDVGTGKTTLINTLLHSLSNDVFCAFVPDPRLELIDFLNYIAQAFHIDNNFTSKGSFLLHFGWFLESVYKQKKKALLIIDEAQLLTQNLLEEIRLLSNIHRDGNHLLNIFFVGQNEFNEILHRPENRAVTQRITLNYQINPLSPEETERYISHRLKIAGTPLPLFSKSAIKTISNYSEGIPRRINVICDHCLITGFIREQPIIDHKIVNECIKEVAIPHYNAPTLSLQNNTAGQTQTGEKKPPHLKKQNAVIISISLLILFLIVSVLFSPSIKVPKELVSTYQTTLRYLLSQTDPTPTDQQPDRMSTERSENEAPVNAGMATKEDASRENQQRVVIQQTSPEEQSKIPAIEASTKTDTLQQLDSKTEDSTVNSNTRESTTPGVLSQPEPGYSALKPEVPIVEHDTIPADRPEKTVSDPLAAVQEESVVIRFERNSNSLSASNLDMLINLGLGVKNNPTMSLKISGYTDSAGSKQYNDRLSLIRANMVKSYLLGLGVNLEQLTVQGFGSLNPIADNSTEEGRQLNRRVEIETLSP